MNEIDEIKKWMQYQHFCKRYQPLKQIRRCISICGCAFGKFQIKAEFDYFCLIILITHCTKAGTVWNYITSKSTNNFWGYSEPNIDIHK